MKLCVAASLVLTAAAFLPTALARLSLADDVQTHNARTTILYYKNCVSSDGDGYEHVNDCKQGKYEDDGVCAKMLERQCHKCLEEMNNLRYDTDKLEGRVQRKMDKKCPGKNCEKFTKFMETHKDSMDKVKALEHEICQIAENPAALTGATTSDTKPEPDREPDIEESDEEDEGKLASLEKVIDECGKVDFYKQQGKMNIERLNVGNKLKIKKSMQAVKEADCNRRQRGRRLSDDESDEQDSDEESDNESEEDESEEKESQEDTEEESQEEDDAKIDFAPALVSTTSIKRAVCQNMIDKQQEHDDLVVELQMKLKKEEDVWNENVAEQQLKCDEMCSDLHDLGGKDRRCSLTP